MESSLSERVAQVRARIGSAANQANVSPDSITLVGVGKRHGAHSIRAARGAGIVDFGENYVQEAMGKRAELNGDPAFDGVRWHLIGGLQTNKAKAAVETFSVVQTIDRESVATALSRRAIDAGRVLPVLIEVNLSDEPQRSGVGFETLDELCETVSSLSGLSLTGLMGIAPVGPDPRPHFARLRAAFDRLPAANRTTLSMGMSQDFEIAIAEGANLVRVGTAIFGERSPVS